MIAIDERRRHAILHFEQAQARRNAASKEIGAAKAKKDEATAERLMAEVFEFKTGIPKLEAEAKAAEEELNKVLATIPNLPLVKCRTARTRPAMSSIISLAINASMRSSPRSISEFDEALGMMDFEPAAKLSGARFVVLKIGLARIGSARSGQLMLDVRTGESMATPKVNPPLLVRDAVMFGTAQLPKFRDDQFLPPKNLMSHRSSR